MTNEEARDAVMGVFDNAVLEFSETIAEAIQHFNTDDGETVFQMLDELREVSKTRNLQMPNFDEIWAMEIENEGIIDD